MIPIDSQWTDRTLAQPYVSDPADVKLERSTSPAADRGLESLSTSRRLDANEPTSSMGVRPVAAASDIAEKDGGDATADDHFHEVSDVTVPA